MEDSVLDTRSEMQSRLCTRAGTGVVCGPSQNALASIVGGQQRRLCVEFDLHVASRCSSPWTYSHGRHRNWFSARHVATGIAATWTLATPAQAAINAQCYAVVERCLGLALCAETKRPNPPLSRTSQSFPKLFLLAGPEVQAGFASDQLLSMIAPKCLQHGLQPWRGAAAASSPTFALSAARSKRQSALRPASRLSQFCWATAIAGSRAYRVRGSGESSGASDAARLLPIIDLANYAPAMRANAELRNAPTDSAAATGDGEGEGSAVETAGCSDDPFAVSLYACAPIRRGQEVLIDYGHGKEYCNERLLLEYGFVIEDIPGDRLNLPLGAIAVGLSAAVQAAEKAEAAAAADSNGRGASVRELEVDEEELGGHQARLLSELGDVDAAGLVFHRDGTPSAATHGLVLCLTARKAAELNYPSIEALIASSVKDHPEHSSRANLALSTVASAAIEEIDGAMSAWVDVERAQGTQSEGGEALSSFEAAARDYCRSRRAILGRARAALPQ